MRRNRIVVLVVTALVTTLLACFGTKVIDLGSGGDFGNAVGAASGYVFAAGGAFGEFAVARIDSSTGALAPGTTAEPWGFGEDSSSSTPVGWVSFTPGGGNVAATSMAIQDGAIYVVGPAVGGTYTNTGFGVVSVVDGETSNVTQFTPRDKNNFGGYMGSVQGADISIIGGKAYVFGAVACSPPLNDTLWVAERTLSGANTEAFGDACPSGPVGCRTGYATHISSFGSIGYGDTYVEDDVAYTVSRASSSTSEGRILVSAIDLASPSIAQIQVLFDDDSAIFYPRAIAVQSDGKILVGGYVGESADTTMFLIRYDANGTPDGTTFALPSSGNLSTGADQINDIGLLSNGKIAVVGKSGPSAFSARFLDDGSLDTTFATVGYNLTTPSTGSAAFNGIGVGQRVRAVGNSNDDLLVADYAQ